MIVAYKFERFEFKAFLDFIWDLIQRFQIDQIRFNPHQKISLFNERQLTHIGPDFNLNNPWDFLYVWSRNEKSVRKVTFEQFHKAGTPKIKMTFDLDNRIVTIEEVKGITVDDIEGSLEKFFLTKEVIVVDGSANKWWKYTHPVWWIWLALVFIFRDVAWRVIELAWEHKWISGMILLIVIPVVVGLCINYLTWKFGWK